MNAHIKCWTSTRVRVTLVCIQGLPTFEQDLHEFEWATDEPLRKLQWVWNRHTQRRERVQRQSPPLGILARNERERRRWTAELSGYIDNLVDNYFEDFARIGFSDEGN